MGQFQAVNTQPSVRSEALERRRVRAFMRSSSPSPFSASSSSFPLLSAEASLGFSSAILATQEATPTQPISGRMMRKSWGRQG